MAPDRPLRHIIKGHILTESSGKSPPGDPLDASGDEDPHPSSRSSKIKKLLTKPVDPSLPSTSKSPVKDRPVTERATAAKMPKERHFAFKSLKPASPFAAYKKPDSDDEDDLPRVYDNGVGLVSSDESHPSESSSARTSMERFGEGHPTVEQILRGVGDRTCDFCHKIYPKRKSRYSKHFCTRKCANSYVDLPVKPPMSKNLSSASSSLKSRLRDVSMSTDTPSHGSTEVTASRRSTRTRKSSKRLADTDGEDFLDSDDAASSIPTSSSRSARSDGSSVRRRNSAIKMVKIEPAGSHGPSPEIPCSRASLASSSARNGFPLRRSSSGRLSKSDIEETSPKKRISVRSLSQQDDNFFKGKPEYVLNSIKTKPVVTWDTTEAAAFGDTVGGSKLATKMLTSQIDGQCLVLFDQPHVWIHLGFSAKKASELISQVKLLEGFQREALKTWYQNRVPEILAAVADLERKTD